jgi:hypothetical protein
MTGASAPLPYVLVPQLMVEESVRNGSAGKPFTAPHAQGLPFCILALAVLDVSANLLYGFERFKALGRMA